jgi:transcriptional regulator with XRE-family HTH domain
VGFGEAMRARREAAGLSLRALAREAHVDPGHLSRIEAGSRPATAAIAEAVDAILDADGALIALAGQRATPLPRIDSDSWRRDGQAVRLPGTLGATEYTQMSTSTVNEGGSSADLGEAIRVLQRVDQLSREVEPHVVRQLRALVHETVAGYEQLDHVAILPALIKQRTWIAALIDQISRPAQRRDLFEVGSEVSGLLGYLSVGRSEFVLARAYCAEAFKLAELAEQLNLQAWTRGLQSICEYYARNYVEALRIAEDGLRYANAGPQSARLLANGVARAMGKLGDVDGVHEAVDSAFALMSANNAPDGLPSSISLGCYSPAQVAGNAATAYLSLGMADRVETYVGLAMPEIQRVGSPWSRSLVMIDQATALASSRQGDLEHASRMAIDAVSVSAGRPIVAVQQRAQDFVRRAAQQWGDTNHLRTVREVLASKLPPA